MDQTVQERSKIFTGYTTVVSFVALTCAFAGYALYNAPYFQIDRLPQLLQSIYHFVHNLYEITDILAIPLLGIFRDFFAHLITRKNSGSRKFISIFISILVAIICLVLAGLAGMKVAEEAEERAWLHNTYKNRYESSEFDNRISIEIAVNFENVYYVDITYNPEPDLSKEVIAYRINNMKPVQAAFSDYFKNPLSALVQGLKKSEYLKYEMTLEPLYTCPIRTLVVIEEILVKQNGIPLIKQNSIDPQRISYGYLAEEMETKTFCPTPEGYWIDLQQCENCYVKWHNSDVVRVDETSIVYFEDWFIDTNIPFSLTAKNLRELLGEKLPEFTDSELRITIRTLEGEADPLAIFPPLEMTTREGRILYHWVDAKNDFYFAINSLADGHKAIEKDSYEEGDYRLLCELTIG